MKGRNGWDDGDRIPTKDKAKLITLQRKLTKANEQRMNVLHEAHMPIYWVKERLYNLEGMTPYVPNDLQDVLDQIAKAAKYLTLERVAVSDMMKTMDEINTILLDLKEEKNGRT